MLLDRTKELESELHKYHRDKEELKLFYFESRLNASLQSYNHELDVLINSLRKESTKTILRRLAQDED